MISTNQFDIVFDCQKVFKTLMNAMARPGKVFSMADSIAKMEKGLSALFASALTVLDNRCRFYVYENEELTRDLVQLTYAVPSALEEADYVFIPKEADMEQVCEAVLKKAKAGTLTEPHKSATVFVLLESLEGGQETCLTGPGINGHIHIALPKEGAAWLEARRRTAWEFPSGVELYFLNPTGQVLCVPRTTRIEVA